MSRHAKLKVVCFCYHGERPVFSPWHANNLQRMVKRHLTVPHDFLCVTDEPKNIAFECETYPLWTAPKIHFPRAFPPCYERLRLFSEWAKKTIGRLVLCLDLDITIRSNIDDLVTDADFRVLSFRGRGQLQGGMFLIRPGKYPEAWDALHEPEVLERARRHYVGGDQGILSALYYERFKSGELPTYSEVDGCYLGDEPDPSWRILFRTGALKPWMPQAFERAIYYEQSGLELPREPSPTSNRNRLQRRLR